MNHRQYVGEQVRRLAGEDADEACGVLIGIGAGIVPELMDTYWRTLDPKVRARLVQVVWQARLESTIPFLGEVLDDLDDDNWTHALDGLVAIGGMAAANMLHDLLFTLNADDLRAFWIREALDQVLAAVPPHVRKPI